MQLIAFRAELMTPRIPDANRFSRDVVEHPALAGIYARRMNPAAEHVVVVVHHDAVLGVDHIALVTFDVVDDSRPIELVDRNTAARHPVVGNGNEGAAEGIHMGNTGSVRMGFGFARGGLFLGSESAADARFMPRRKIVVGTQSAEEVADVRVVTRISTSTVSLTSQVSWCQGSKRTFCQVWLGFNVATTR